MPNRAHIWIVVASTLLPGLAFAQKIHLKAQTIDPSEQVATTLPHAHFGLQSDENYLIQFVGPRSASDEHWIAALGGVFEAYVPENTWVVRLPQSAFAKVAASNRVRWTSLLKPEFKISPSFGRTAFRSTERLTELLQGLRRAAITLFDGRPADGTLARVHSLDCEVLDVAVAGPRIVLEVRGKQAALLSLASLQDVVFVEEACESVTRNDKTAWVVQSNVSGLTPIWAKGIRGENQIAGIIDGVVYKAHNVFRDPNNGNVPGPTHRKLVAYFSSTGQNGADSHGTHVAGTVGGDQFPITGSLYRNGIAYMNKLAVTRLGDVNSANLYTKLLDMYNVGARDFSNSWGDDGTTQYTSHCQQIDQFSYDYEDAMVAFASTNTSTLKTPENAKSVLAVGNCQQTPNQNNPSSGGTGPTSDGRRKPEIWAPGSGINSAGTSSQTSWTSMSGTSMACPGITGSAQLVRQYFRENWIATGKPGRTPGNPSGALIRATMMNSSVDMTGMTGYPGVREGWGRLLLDNGMWFAGEARKTLVFDIRRAQGLTNLQERTYRFTVVDSSSPLRITMTFTDYPAAALAAYAPVNNVDLTVTNPTGTQYLGNQINTTTGLSVTGGTADVINSTEMVLLNNPPKGTYSIRVRANVVQGGTQGFALVINGGVTGLSSSH